ncbi:Endonuclease-reverse transcriptase [Operophtera brumata]|uniref:Endonuclease-reverse transcriptase n=1 Tax=Operophtera brumata TaxID=104452 RepID=A0A0L7LC96_OPEBR|nr:Endonuclease-reverse transcriptase [Operophtera brumata]
MEKMRGAAHRPGPSVSLPATRRYAVADSKLLRLRGSFKTSIKKQPTLLYGCQTWALTAENKIRLRSFQRAVERSMMGLKLRDRIRSSKIRSKTKILDAGKMAARLKWKWAGHIARVKDNRWSERVLHWWPRDGKRERGRPVRRWGDDIIAIATIATALRSSYHCKNTNCAKQDELARDGGGLYSAMDGPRINKIITNNKYNKHG